MSKFGEFRFLGKKFNKEHKMRVRMQAQMKPSGGSAFIKASNIVECGLPTGNEPGLGLTFTDPGAGQPGDWGCEENTWSQPNTTRRILIEVTEMTSPPNQFMLRSTQDAAHSEAVTGASVYVSNDNAVYLLVGTTAHRDTSPDSAGPGTEGFMFLP